jgi:hypothetical protein
MKKIEIKSNEKYTQIQKQFITELKSYITSDVNLLITNGNLAALLLYFSDYKLGENEIKDEMKSENGKPKMYKLGKLDELQIMVDPYMRWDDNKIILKNDDLVIEEIEIIDEENILI